VQARTEGGRGISKGSEPDSPHVAPPVLGHPSDLDVFGRSPYLSGFWGHGFIVSSPDRSPPRACRRGVFLNCRQWWLD
jgi:hypothetical protein